MKIHRDEALEYHSSEPAGKVSITPTKPCRTQRDLSLAYTPGVAVPCLEIQRDPSLAYKYTAKGNLVAVVSNGTAVLGLGNIGAAAGKPVMEGKAVLFKRFADIDVFDIELATTDPKEVIRTCQLLEPTFGGINLEDIKAPDCFIIEEELRRTMNIPVFHDDQHGTAIISGAALLNAVALQGKRMDEVEVVFNGAGASGVSCAEHLIRLGVRRDRITMCDSQGVIYKGRTKGMNEYKERFAVNTNARTLAEALVGADVFFGLSCADCVTPEMIQGMAERPIIFALANPDPEIPYDVAKAARPDAIIASGRSDYPNQVNNVLGFPFIFRGRARRSRHGHQRRNETGRYSRPGRAGSRGRARRSTPRLRHREHGVRAGIHHPQAIRLARAHLGGVGDSEGGHGYRRRTVPRGPGRVSGATRTAARQSARSDAHRDSKGEARSAPGGFPGRRRRQNSARGPDSDR